MDSNTLLFYKLNKYQNKLGKDPNSIIYQQKYAYYKDLIGGGGKWKITFNDTQKSVTVKNYLKKGTDNTPTDVNLYFTEEQYGKVSKIKEKIKKKKIDRTYSVDKYVVNGIEYKKNIVYKRQGYNLCLSNIDLNFQKSKIPKIILNYRKIKHNDNDLLGDDFIYEHHVTADFLRNEPTIVTNDVCNNENMFKY